MPYDIFRKILIYVYETTVEDISDENCCVKCVQCQSIDTQLLYTGYPVSVDLLLKACRKHPQVGIFRIKNINQETTLSIHRLAFNTMNRGDIANVNFKLRLYGIGDDKSEIRATETSLTIDACSFKTTIFNSDAHEMPIIKKKLSKVLLKWYDLLFGCH